MSPRVGRRTRTLAIEDSSMTEAALQGGWESGIRHISGSSRISWRYVGESGRREPYGHGHERVQCTQLPVSSLGHPEKAVEGEFTSYAKYMLLLECLRYLLLATFA